MRRTPAAGGQRGALGAALLDVSQDAVTLRRRRQRPEPRAGGEGSPSVSLPNCATASCTASSCRGRGTSRRVQAEQVCPEFCIALFTAAGIAFSNGASSRTTHADLPPSSRHTFLMPSPASAATRRPAASDPVKLTMSTSACVTSASPAVRPSPETTFRTPAGRPISCAASASMNAESGASSEGFSTTVQPAASAGATLQTTWCNG